MIMRKGTPNDLIELQQLYVDTIRNICTADYNSEQLNVWSAGIENEQRWRDVLTMQFVLVVQEGKEIAGFCTVRIGFKVI